MDLEKLEDRLGYHFGDRGVLLQALTHTSFGHENLQEKPTQLRDNERLEFLGDAILDVVVSDLLLESFPEAPEGQLSKLRAAVVNEKTLAQIARTIELQAFVRLGRGEAATKGAEKPSILSCALEAVIAAVYLDGGFHAVYPVVRHLFVPLLGNSPGRALGGDGLLVPFQDFKTQLQELVQARWKVTPDYSTRRASGPDHARVFEVEVRIQGKVLAIATGASKKEAEQNAARDAVTELGEGHAREPRDGAARAPSPEL